MRNRKHRIAAVSPSGLRTFFQRLVSPAFAAVGLADRELVDYATDLLSRFARTEQLYRIRDAHGKPLESIAEMMMEMVRYQAPEVPYKFDRELEIRRHSGDYALFMSGVFRAYVEHHSLLNYYLAEGRRTYSAVAELKQLSFAADAKIFQALAADFERLSGALDYMRKVYMRPELHGGAYGDLLRKMDQQSKAR